jgi:hypothetical protein
MPDGPLNGLANGRPQRLLRKQSVEVFVRHTHSCPHQRKGRNFHKCPCPKYVYIYKDGAASRVSAKSGSWAEAEKKAQEVRNSWVPELAELKRLRAEKAMGRLRIEEAIVVIVHGVLGAAPNSRPIACPIAPGTAGCRRCEQARVCPHFRNQSGQPQLSEPRKPGSLPMR